MQTAKFFFDDLIDDLIVVTVLSQLMPPINPIVFILYVLFSNRVSCCVECMDIATHSSQTMTSVLLLIINTAASI